MKSARIKITYELHNGLGCHQFVIEVENAWKISRQFASNPEMAFWKALGTHDGLYAAGYSSDWQVGDNVSILQPSISDIEQLAQAALSAAKDGEA